MIQIAENYGSDRGKLRVEPHILDLLTKELPSSTLKVALLHHPLDWLEDRTRDAVSKLLTSRIDIALFGHVHTGDLANLAHGDSDCLFVQSPPLRADWSKGTNGYGVIRCNTKHKRYEVDYRSYSKTRRAFVRGEDFADMGIRYPRPEDKEFFVDNPMDLTLTQKFVDGCPYDYTDWYRNNIRSKAGGLPFFIMPKARRILKSGDDQWLEPAKPIDKISLNSSRDQFFVAPLDAGSTTAAFLVFKRIGETFSDHKAIPAFFDASQSKINRASILQAINQTLLVSYSHKETLKLAESGFITLVVDGLSLADADQFNNFRGIASKFFPRVRFIYFLSTEKRGFGTSGPENLKLFVDDDEVYEFAQLEVADIRTMVQLWRPGLSVDAVDAIVGHVVESFKQMDEPLFATTVAVVVETLSHDPDFKPINKSRLLERYVECLLGRFELEDVREGTFTSSDKIRFLGYIAQQLLESNRIGLTEDEWIHYENSYQEQYLIDLPAGMLEEFIEKGLLTLWNGEITFRGDYLFSFFIARQMKSDENFAHEILNDDGVFKFYREIVFYGELEGTDARSVLDKTYLIIGELEETLLENYSRSGIDLMEEWNVTRNEGREEEEAYVALHDASDRLGNTKPSAEHADRVSDSQLAQVKRRRGVAKRAAVREAEAKLFIVMRLYALLLKNTLQLPADDKLRHLQKLYEAAEIWVGFLCARRADIGTHPIVVTGGIQFINIEAAFDPERSMRNFKFNAPNTMARILSESIRNPQMSVALRRVMQDLSPMGQKFVRDTLLDIPSKDNRIAYVESLLSETETDLVTASLLTLRSKFLAAGRSRDLRNHIEQIVQRLERENTSACGVSFERMKKARLVRDLKENAIDRK